eukprot:gene8394-2071_t
MLLTWIARTPLVRQRQVPYAQQGKANSDYGTPLKCGLKS